MSTEMTREEFTTALESFRRRAINLWDYSNTDSYTFPKLPELEAAENTRRNELLDHDAAQRSTIQQLEARVKDLEEESRQWEKGSLVALLRENKALKALVAQLQGEA